MKKNKVVATTTPSYQRQIRTSEAIQGLWVLQQFLKLYTEYIAHRYELDSCINIISYTHAAGLQGEYAVHVMQDLLLWTNSERDVRI
jgi:hypothetical protein